MMHYRYEVRQDDGTTTVGMLAAADAMQAAGQLRAEGLKVVQITPVESASMTFLQKLKNLNHASGPSPRDILGFTTQLAVMIRAGISIRAAIEGIAEQADNPRFKQMLLDIKRDVESGKSFSDALVRYPKHFNTLYVNMVRASEMSGSFAHMLDRIAGYLAQQLETRRMVIGAMIYPTVICVMAVGVTIFLLTFVLPKFAMVFKGKESILPWPTLFLMSLSAFMVKYWWAVLLGMVVSLGGIWGFIRTEVGRLWFDHGKLAAPIFKRMFRALYISRSLHTMGELVNAGVPMLDTLAITGAIAGNQLYRNMWNAVHGAVQQGKKISHTLTRTTLLPKAVVQMISAGEESGKLGEVLDEVSDFYATQLRDAIKAVTGMIEPIAIVMMGTVVGFIAMAIILPIFKMSALVK